MRRPAGRLFFSRDPANSSTLPDAGRSHACPEQDGGLSPPNIFWISPCNAFQRDRGIRSVRGSRRSGFRQITGVPFSGTERIGGFFFWTSSSKFSSRRQIVQAQNNLASLWKTLPAVTRSVPPPSLKFPQTNLRTGFFSKKRLFLSLWREDPSNLYTHLSCSPDGLRLHLP